jgi:multiple sugar transport system ATP-binding protein
MAELTLDGVTKVFTEDDGNEIVAVDDVNIRTEDGEFLVLVGPSGCGKSTTLRMIAGLETVTRGELRLGTERMNEKQPADRNIAMVFQSYALYPHMTVRQNMSFGLEESTDLDSESIEGKVTDAARMMDIEPLLDRKPSELSGGQQQRVALGRAIVRDPEVFLMDEPLSNLDAKLRAGMRTEIQRLQEDLDVTTVYVTHDQTEAMTMGDRIAVLNDGRLMQVGSPLELYHRPANRFVAGFIGDPSMNFFPVTREGDRLVGDGFEYGLSAETAENLGETTDCVLGIRPEDIEVVETATGDHDFRTTVEVVEPMGNENNVYLSFPGASTGPDGDDDERFVATVGGLRRIERGAEVVAHIPEEAIHVFDAETGDALHSRVLEEGVETSAPVN